VVAATEWPFALKTSRKWPAGLEQGFPIAQTGLVGLMRTVP
jgi:hypothetical protein